MNLKKIWRQLTAPKIFNRGYLPEAGGHQVYFVEMGNPRGIPVLVFHGGPGGGMNLRYAQPFDRRKYRVILFDQRGCGKSLPLGEMKNNNTGALLEDAARLLRYLGIEDRVIVRGASWGSTLALLFAEKYPEKVSKLLISQIYLADETGQKWNLETSRLFYPDIWERIEQEAETGEPVLDYYANLINSDDVMKQIRAANLAGQLRTLSGVGQSAAGVQGTDARKSGGNPHFAELSARALFYGGKPDFEKCRQNCRHSDPDGA